MTNTAINFAQQFDTLFTSESAGLSFREIPLFQALRRALIGTGDRFHVEEYHGGAHQVRFTGNGQFGRSNARCELSDLMIIVYSPASKIARLTYLQAKSEKATLPVVCGRKFSANLEQWFLLSHRPTITGIGDFNPPADLLSGATLNSVGTLAFFYKDAAGRFQVYYATARHLSPAATYSQRYGRLQAMGPCAVVNTGGYSECVAACGNALFAESLYRLEIGTPISPSIGPVSVRNWLAGNLRLRFLAGAQTDRQTTIAGELLDILGAERADEPASGSLGARNLIIIRSDAEPRRPN